IAATQEEGCAHRKSAAICYGANAFGAVAGVMLATFWLLETLGNRMTLWSACGLNMLVALAALALAKGEATLTPSASTDPKSSLARQLPKGETMPASPFYAAAAFSGFGFFLMELVWYRMLAPLLGGSTFTFGLILAVALTGIALGSLATAWFLSRRAPTVNGLAWLCSLQAILLAAPFATGDRLATCA